MVIRPSDPDRPHRLGATSADAAASSPAVRREDAPAQNAPASAPATDRAEVSSEARELLARVTGSDAAVPAIAPEKLRQVADRIRSGHYDRPEVLDQVAKQARADVTGPRTDD